MIFIDEKQLYSLLTPTEVIEAIEKSFYIMDSEQVEVPQRVHINRDGNVILLMPCLTDKRFAVKIVSVYPGNTKLGLPALYGTVVLNDGKTGQPLAIIDGTSLTAVRTAAVGAVGAKYTVPEEIETLGIIGAGAQGFHHAWFIGIEKQIKKLMVFDVVEEKAASLASDIKKKLPHIQTVIAKDSRQLVKGSQLIVTATTSDTPVVPDELGLIMNKHFIGVGSYKPRCVNCQIPFTGSLNKFGSILTMRLRKLVT